MFFYNFLLDLRIRGIKREEERVRKANWRQRKREIDPDYFQKAKEYDRLRKHKVRDLMSSASETSSQSETASRSEKSTSTEISMPIKNTKPSYYKILNRSKQIQEILGPSPSTHTSVLKHVLKKSMKSPRKSQGLSGMVMKLHNKTNEIPGKNGNLSKELRKIAVLRSKWRHDKAQDITEKLKEQL